MRKKWTVCGLLAALAAMLCLTGCGTAKKQPLPEDPLIFSRTEAEVPQGADVDLPVMLEGGGRIYVPYGSIRAAGPLRDLSYAFGDCLGYVHPDEKERVYALSDDPTGGEWIIVSYEGGIMDQPMVWRELNAAGPVPESVTPFEDEVEK